MVTRVCVSVCLSAAACLHYCMDPDVTWRSGRGCPLVVHYWADLQSAHGLRCYGDWKYYANAWQSPAVSVRPTARRTHYACVRRAAKTPLTGDKIDAPAACAVPFRPYCGGVVTRTRNVSEYLLVLALCLVHSFIHSFFAAQFICCPFPTAPLAPHCIPH